MADSNTIATLGAAAIGAVALLINGARILGQKKNEADTSRNGLFNAAKNEASRDLLSAQLAFAESLRTDRVDFVSQIKELRLALKASEDRITEIIIDRANKIYALDEAAKQIIICHESVTRLEALVSSLRSEITALREKRDKDG